jgi:hypothetical protein
MAETEPQSAAAQALKARKRKLHMFDFSFESTSGTVGVWVPVKSEEINARLQARRDLQAAVGKDVETVEDDDLLRVDQATLILLSQCCRDPKDPHGIPLFGPPSYMAKTLKDHELVKLLDFLTEARRRESRDHEHSELSDADVDEMRGALSLAEREHIVDILGGWSRDALMELCWSLSRAPEN